MKNIIINGALIGLVGLSSCSKEELFENDQDVSHETAAATFQNPFEEVGKVHNEALQYVFNEPEFDPANSDQSELIYHSVNDYLESQGMSGINNEGMIKAISDAPGILIQLGGETETVKDSFWLYVESDFAAMESDILREYYDTVSVITNIDERKAKSLEYEKCVYDHAFLSKSVKDRLLRSFAIYRYSSAFWENHEWKHGMSEAMGLFAEYANMQYSSDDPCAGCCAGMAAAVSAMAPGNGNDSTGAG